MARGIKKAGERVFNAANELFQVWEKSGIESREFQNRYKEIRNGLSFEERLALLTVMGHAFQARLS